MMARSLQISRAAQISNSPEPKLPVLWRATLHVIHSNSRQEFLFRGTSDVAEATAEATRLLEKSWAPAAAATEIVGVERIGRLWN